ncbi:orotate phosphoribosyltransferase [Cryobacterium tepidiphilum]|nr:phosphoribosyltransferase family protein [Cryobacterium tepidiphilum]
MADPANEVSVSKELKFYDENRVRLSDVETLAELQQDILRASFQRGAVQLESGVEQPYFFEKYLMVARPTILRRIARFLAARIPAGTDRVAAPTLGAVAIGTAVSLESGLPLAIVRSGQGDKRRGRAVEGGLHPGEIVVLIEDVVVTGQRALRAVEELRAAGVEVGLVVSVVDCDRGAAAEFAKAGLDYDPLFRSSVLLPEGVS